MKQLLIKFPTRQRPVKFFQLLALYYDLLDSPEDAFFVASLDEDDPTLKDYMSIAPGLRPNIKIHFDVGISGSKIAAVNRDIDKYPDWDILLLASDDMIPFQEGYDTIIRQKMKEFYPDLDGVLWFNDGYAGDQLNTLCILGCVYYHRFGYIYNPGYKSMFADNEFQAVATNLGKQTYIDQVIIRHEHPINNGDMTNYDDLYKANDGPWNADAAFFAMRREEGFKP